MSDNNIAIYYDAEFTGLHRDSTFISIGMVSESGSKFYAEFTDYDRTQLNEWLEDNVIKNLTLEKLANGEDNFVRKLQHDDSCYSIKVRGDRVLIKKELYDWLYNEYSKSYNQLKIFTDCYAYDWMLLIDLLTDNGNALDVPNFINYIPIDLSTMLFAIGEDPDVNREMFAYEATYIDSSAENKHNSLWDAVIIERCFDRINQLISLGKRMKSFK